MSTVSAYTRAVSDAELATLASKLTSSAACFVEGPMESTFIEPSSLGCELLTRLWLVRCFDATVELYARRISFDVEKPWLVRVIAEQQPGEGWESHVLRTGEERALILHEGGDQFGEEFRYPGVQPGKDEVVRLKTVEYEADGGTPVVRWLALEAVRREEVAKGS
ncbi:MAG: hypothetical protein K6T30_03825 [Alicyclobacillus sp.]|nr:hypothetical protein [Alicyclobacillus sp.]